MSPTSHEEVLTRIYFGTSRGVSSGKRQVHGTSLHAKCNFSVRDNTYWRATLSVQLVLLLTGIIRQQSELLGAIKGHYETLTAAAISVFFVQLNAQA